jgi:hypothetical protein
MSDPALAKPATSNDGISPRDSLIYEQSCEDFRSINEIFWRVPFIAMTLTGGIAAGVGTIRFSPQVQSALLFFLCLCNISFVVIILRLRLGVMEMLLKRIYEYEGRKKPRTSYAVVTVFTLLFSVSGAFALYGALHPDIVLLPSQTNTGGRPTNASTGSNLQGTPPPVSSTSQPAAKP